MEVHIVCNADFSERSARRTAILNGFRERQLDVGVGIIPLKIPRLRKGVFFPNFLKRWQRATNIVNNSVIEAIINSISTNKISDLLEAFDIPGIAKSQASQVCQSITYEISLFHNRPIAGDWIYLWTDVAYTSVRRDGEVVNVGIFSAMGVNSTGQRQSLGFQIFPAETEENWTIFLQWLVNRGLRGVELVITDGHSSIKPAISKVLNTKYQRCSAHFMCNAYTHVDSKNLDKMIAELSFAFAQGDPTSVEKQFYSMIDRWYFEYPNFSEYLRSAMPNLISYLEFPQVN
jgi:transposase-like protein